MVMEMTPASSAMTHLMKSNDQSLQAPALCGACFFQPCIFPGLCFFRPERDYKAHITAAGVSEQQQQLNPNLVLPASRASVRLAGELSFAMQRLLGNSSCSPRFRLAFACGECPTGAPLGFAPNRCFTSPGHRFEITMKTVNEKGPPQG